MSHAVRFEVLVIPNISWDRLIDRYRQLDALGIDLAGCADHFVDWTNPSNLWFDFQSVLAAASQVTERLRMRPTVAQIPLRDPGTLARQILSLDHLSSGRIELGLGIGLEIDPSYEMMGIPNWGVKERVARLKEYVEIVDSMLRNEVTTYEGTYYSVTGAILNPRPVQTPRPPIAIAGMGPVMLKRVARYADIWNSISFAEDFDAQLVETRERMQKIDEACAKLDRDPATLARSYTMLDVGARKSGGRISYYQSRDAFEDMVGRVLSLGITEVSLYYPLIDDQISMFEQVAEDVIPRIRAEHSK